MQRRSLICQASAGASPQSPNALPYPAMRFDVETLDDALLKLYPELLSRHPAIEASRGLFSEIVGVSIEIQQARARLSRSETRAKVFSSLGELLWYLTGDNRLDFIEPYISRYRKDSEDGTTVYGGYGPRFFRQRGHDQIRNVITLLRERPTSRKAVIQIINAEDVAEKHDEIPCTTTLQFLIREGRLQLIATMRSNDAYLGLPHDVFCFTMTQEIVSPALSVSSSVATFTLLGVCISTNVIAKTPSV